MCRGAAASLCLTPDPDAWQPLAPSPIAFDEGYAVPRELTVEEIHGIVRAFASTAKRAVDAGFELLEFTTRTGIWRTNFSRRFLIRGRTNMAALWKTGCVFR